MNFERRSKQVIPPDSTILGPFIYQREYAAAYIRREHLV